MHWVLWNTNGIAVLTGRTMDWPESTELLVVAFPSGHPKGPEAVTDTLLAAMDTIRPEDHHHAVTTPLG